MAEYVLELDKLDIGYGKEPFLKRVTLTVKPGEILSLIGPNGSGKTTILKVLTGQLKALGGRTVLIGRDINTLTSNEISRTTAMVMTERPRPELMTAKEVVELGRYPYVGTLGILSDFDREKVREAMAVLKIWDIENKYFHELSDGQKQKVLLAKALCQEPDLLILDEPTSYLDVKVKIELLKLIWSLAKEKNIAIIMSLHEIDLALKISDQVALIDGEKIARLGTSEEIIGSGEIEKVFDLKNGEYDPLTGQVFLDFGSKDDGKQDLEYVLPADIERRSFEIITKELLERGIIIPDEEAPVTKRVIHTSADFDYARTMCYSKDAIKIARELIKNGCDIVTDTNMAKAGINKTRLSGFGGEVHCFMADEDVALKAKERGVTRATVSMERAAKLSKPVIFAVGNAPTALISLHEMIEKGTFLPAFVIGVPVGFVNVVQAKELIMTTEVPYIINKGRKGGSNVAAAIVNALMYGI